MISRIFYPILLSFFFFQLNAQPWAEVSSSVPPNFYRMKVSGDAVLSEVKTQKGKGFKAFKRWEKYWEQRVFNDGSFPPANLVQKNWESYQLEKSFSALIPGSSWTSLGPNSSSGGYAGIGRINRITFHPTNTSIIFACTAGGGLWKTINGGSSWVPLTDNLASIGTSGLVINPVDPNIMYLATGDGDGADTYSYGVLKSTDGGVSWNATGLTFTTGVVIYKLQPHPTDPNILLAGTNGGLYRTANGGTSWTKVVASGQFYDIEALTSTNMVATTKGGLYRSTDSGATWVLVTTIASTGRIALAVSASNSDFVAALVSNTSNGFKGFYASVDGGLTYTLRSSTPNLMGWETNGSDSGGQAWYDLCVAVSPVDVNQIVVGGVNTWKSTNGGVSWTIMTNWYQTSTVPAMHADQHDLIFQNSTTLFSANDGGIYRSTNNGVSWTDLTNGMSISQLYRASAAQTDIRVIAGLQDNGTKLRSTTGTWSDEIGGDGMDCAIDPTNASYMYGTLYYGDIQRSTNGGTSWSSITPSTGTDGAWVSPVLLDPVNPATIYLGYRDLMKSVDRGTTWTKISAGQTGGNFISNIAVAPSNPMVIYISWGTSMAKTTDGGTTWATITSPLASTISSLLVDPTNPNNVYATYSNFTAGSKVYHSNNGGTAWTNISGTLPNIPANKIIYQTGSNGALYLGMDVGVYYRDNTQTDWSLYNSGLPNVEIFDIEIRYSDKKLIAATYGRGLWESPLYVATPLTLPVVSSFTPTSGSRNTSVTITGSNFSGVTAVTFGGVAATSFVVNSPTSITAVVGNGASGNVSVTNSAGSGNLAGFTFINTTPTLSSFTPTSGKTGQVVTITGTNFTGTTAVSFGGTAASAFTVVSATSITATVGAGASGSISVTTAAGTGTLAGFTYLPPPAISSFSPTSASTGQTVTLTGTNFTGATAVSFGGVAASSFTVVSATSITAVVGAGATGSISVTTGNGTGTRAGFTFIGTILPPTITSFTPTSGKTGQVITITGANFTGTTAVSFGGTAARNFTVISATSINATVGAGSSGNISVTNTSGTAALPGFTYLPPPTITSFSPVSAGKNAVVSIIGTNFTGTTSVSFGGIAATSFTVVSPTNLTAVVGSGATGNVRVTTSNGAISKGGFTFIPAPAITSFSPTSAGKGQTVTLTGTNFTGTTAVSFGGTPATSFTVVNSTTISAVVGAGTSGNISVTSVNGVGTIAGFSYLAVIPVPTITSFTPTSAKTGQVVTITGTNLSGANSIKFGGTNASSFTITSPTSISAVIGSGTSGSVQVSTLAGTATLAGFTYIPVPTLLSFSPSKAAPGSTVSFSGTGFSTNALNNDVWIGATKATVISSTANSISTIVPSGASTDYIRVLNKETQLAIQSNNFFIATFSPSKDSILSSEIAPKLDLNTLANPEDIRVSDIDGDGKPDIIVANYTAGSISVFRNTSTSGSLDISNFSRKDFVSGTNATFISVADLDNDGKQDLIVANQGENSISILKNISISGNVLFNSPVKITTPLTPIGIGIGDFDRNGWLDIVTANHGNNTVSIFTNKGVFNSLAGSNFNTGFTLTTGLNPITLDVADLDGDNKMDIAVGNYGSKTVSVFKNNYATGFLNSNSFSSKIDFNAGNSPGYLKLGDMDGDSKLDIVVLAEGANSVGILRNTSTSGVISLSSFAPRVNFNTGVTPYYISIGDMTGNGKLDLLVTNFAEGTASLWQNKAVPGSITSSSFFKRLNFTVGTKPYAGLLADIDGDAKTDILVSNSGSNTISILRNIIGAQMVVSPTSTTLPATGGSLTANVSSNLIWKVSSNSPWLIPTVVSGRNSGTLRITFTANTGAARKGIISFTADGIVKTMEISQSAKPGLLNPDKELYEGSLSHGELSLDVISDLNWDLYPNPSNGVINIAIHFPNLELIGSLNIQDINGRVVKSMTHLRTGNYQIDLSSEPKGTYLFSLKGENNDHIIYKKLIIN